MRRFKTIYNKSFIELNAQTEKNFVKRVELLYGFTPIEIIEITTSKRIRAEEKQKISWNKRDAYLNELRLMSMIPESDK